MAGSRVKLALVVLIGGLLAIVIAGLGVWQIQRLAWKRDLIAKVESRIHAEPVGFDTLDLSAPAEQEYRRVTLTGEFDNDAESFIKAVTEQGGGYWVITPLKRPDGSIVLINRGFVLSDKRDPAQRGAASPQGTTTVTGLVRLSRPDGTLLQSNEPAENRWYSTDVAAISAARGLDQGHVVTSVFVDADAADIPADAYPVGGLTIVNFYNNHLVYAITWFILAAMVVAFVVMIIRHERKGS